MAKYALRRVRRKTDGMNETYYLDSSTGEEIPYDNLGGYSIIEALGASLDQLGLSKKAEEKAKEVEEQKASEEHRSGKSDRSGEYYEGVDSNNPGLDPRTASNNFGYAREDKILNAIANTPNPIAPTQMGARMINNARRINNMYAVSQGRQVLGIEGDMKKPGAGQLGDIKINGKTYPVGYEAMEPVKKDSFISKGDVAEFIGGTVGGMVAGPLGGIAGKVAGRQALKDKEPEKLGRTNLTMEEARRRQSIASDQAKPRAPSSQATAGRGLMARAQSSVNLGKEPGRGLMDLSPTFEARASGGINYAHPGRGPVTQGLQGETVDTMNRLAEFQPGGLNVTSAYRSPSVNASVGGSRGSLHQTGQAFDLSTKGLTDQQKRDLVERSVMSGAQEIGTYPDQSLHIASTQRYAPLDNTTGGVTAMYDRSRFNMANAPDWFKEGLTQTRLAPTPTEKPQQETMVAENDPMSLGRGFVDSMTNNNPEAKAATRQSTPTARAFVDLSRPTSFSDADKMAMAQTLAGEIDLRRTDLNTPDGIKEANGILSTIENRKGKYGSIKDVIGATNQYSTWNTDAAANTAIKNYQANPKMYDSLVNDFVSNPNNNLGFTSYHADYATPGWSTDMADQTQIGAHKFGSLPEYKNAFGSNFGRFGIASTPQNTGPKQVGAGTEARATAKASFSTAANTSASVGSPTSRGMASDENANRSTSASRESRSSIGSSTSGRSTTSRSSSEGKGSYGSSGRSGYSSIGSSSGFSSGKSSTGSSGKGSYGSSGRSGYSSVGADKSSGFGSKSRDASQPGGRVDRDEKGWK